MIMLFEFGIIFDAVLCYLVVRALADMCERPRAPRMQWMWRAWARTRNGLVDRVAAMLLNCVICVLYSDFVSKRRRFCFQKEVIVLLIVSKKR